MTHRRVWLASAILILAALVAIAWLFSHRPASPLESFVGENPALISARASQYRGDYANASAAYQTALALAKNPEERGVVRYAMATLKDAEGDSAGAISAMKQIAADRSYAPATRAYAVEYMGMMRDAYWRDPAVTEEIFKDPPYDSMRAPGDDDLSYRRLFEYAASFYPLAMAEVKAAGWYAGELALSTTTPDAASYAGIVKRRLALADENIAALERSSAPNASSYIPDILQNESWVIGRLAVAGLLPLSAREAAQQKFEAACLAYSCPLGYDGVERFMYANFLLLAYGPSRAADIHALLAPLSTSGYASSAIVRTLKKLPSLPAEGYSNYSAIARRLAMADPSFKDFLVSLGWGPSDFGG